MISNIIYLLKVLQKKDRRTMIAFFFIFLIFPVFIFWGFVKEVITYNSYEKITGSVTNTRTSFLLFKYARIQYIYRNVMNEQRVYFFPVLENYEKGDNVNLKYNKMLNYISTDKIFIIRSTYYFTIFAFSMLLVFMINNALSKKVFKLKLDNGDFTG